MKKFSAEMKVVRFGAEDMIVTSGPLTMTWQNNMGDGNKGNGVVIYDGHNYTMSSATDLNALISAMDSKIGGITADTKLWYPGDDQAKNTLGGVLKNEYSKDNGITSTLWNGTYKYDTTNKWFKKQ